MRQLLVALLTPLLISAQLTAAARAAVASRQRPSQESARSKESTQSKEAARAKEITQAKERDRQTAVQLLAREITRAGLFYRVSDSVTVWTEAADVLWPHRPDLAERALRDAWTASERDFLDEAKERSASERERVVVAHEMRTGMRSSILVVARRHKPELVKEFLDSIKERPEDAAAAHNLPIAFGTGSLRQQQLARAAQQLAASDPERAVEFASASLDYGMPQELQAIFKELAASAPQHARELFRRAAAVFAADQSLNIYDAVFLASYLKFSREPETDTALVRTFLDAALERMLRLRQQQVTSGSRDEGQRSAMLMSLSYLQPFFQTYHPERLNELAVLAQQLRPELSAEQFETDAVNLTSSDNPYTPENILSRAASERDAGRRDELYLQAALKFAVEKKFERALEAALSAREGGRREPFLTHIRFQYAQHLAATGELNEGAKV